MLKSRIINDCIKTILPILITDLLLKSSFNIFVTIKTSTDCMLDTVITHFTTMTTGKVAETILYLHFIQCVVFHREFSSSFYDERLHSP